MNQAVDGMNDERAFIFTCFGAPHTSRTHTHAGSHWPHPQREKPEPRRPRPRLRRGADHDAARAHVGRVDIDDPRGRFRCALPLPPDPAPSPARAPFAPLPRAARPSQPRSPRPPSLAGDVRRLVEHIRDRAAGPPAALHAPSPQASLARAGAVPRCARRRLAASTRSLGSARATSSPSRTCSLWGTAGGAAACARGLLA